MEDITMGMGGGASQGNNEQPIHNNNNNNNNNIPLIAPMVGGSIFEPPKPYNNNIVTIGHVGDSSSNSVIPISYLNFPNVSSYLASNDNPSSMENNYLIIPNELDQLAKQILGPNKVDPNMMDPKRLKKLELNRLSVQKCRNRKSEYILGLEKQLRTIQERVITLQKQIESTTDQNEVSKSEREELKQKLEAVEKINSLKKDETEKYTAEVKILREIHMKQLEEPFIGTPMLDWNSDDLQLMSSYPISDPVVVENDDETQEMIIDDMAPNQDN